MVVRFYCSVFCSYSVVLQSWFGSVKIIFHLTDVSSLHLVQGLIVNVLVFNKIVLRFTRFKGFTLFRGPCAELTPGINPIIFPRQIEKSTRVFYTLFRFKLTRMAVRIMK